MLNFLEEKYLGALKLLLALEAGMQLAYGMGIFMLAVLLCGSGMLEVSRWCFFVLRKYGVTYIT